MRRVVLEARLWHLAAFVVVVIVTWVLVSTATAGR